MNTPEREEKNKMAKGRPRMSREVAEYPKPLKMTQKEEVDMEEKPIYPAQFHKVKEGKIVIDRFPALEAMKGKQIAGWTIEDDEMIKEMNPWIEEDPKMVRVGKNIEEKYEKKLIELLKSYRLRSHGHTKTNYKMSFTTPWRIFIYIVMPFVLCNALATF